jgi:hypothetical protein
LYCDAAGKVVVRTLSKPVLARDIAEHIDFIGGVHTFPRMLANAARVIV